MYIYDLAASAGAPNQVGTFSGGLLRPVVTMDVNGMRLPCYALAFNPRKPELLATGDATGIQIWRLPSNLSSVRRGEEGLLKKLAAADDASEVLRNMYSP